MQLSEGNLLDRHPVFQSQALDLAAQALLHAWGDVGGMDAKSLLGQVDRLW